MIVAQPVDVEKATARIVRGLAPVAFRNRPQAVRVTLHCSSRPRSSRLRCSFSVYGERRLIERDVLVVRPVRRHRQRVFEDLSGFVSYSRARSLYVDPVG